MEETQVQNKLAQVRLIAMDVDGVLTDGAVIYDSHQREVKQFSVLDGLGIQLALYAGIPVVWITGRSSEAVQKRADELKVTHLYMGTKNKSIPVAELMAKYGLQSKHVAYIGDDLNDLPAFSLAGVKFAPPNAVGEISALADFVTSKPGGSGAVREMIDTILKAKELWNGAVEAFLAESMKPSETKA